MAGCAGLRTSGKRGRSSAQLPAILPALLSGFLMVVLLAPLAPAFAKKPGEVHCYRGICHRVKTIAETRALVGRDTTVEASHYGHCREDRFNPCTLTSSGEVYRADRPDNAASPVLPDGTVVLLYNPETRRAAVVRINNAGPYMGRRLLDVSRGTAHKLGFAKKGVTGLVLRVLRAPLERESRYSRRRSYRALPGYIGEHEDVDAAHRAVLEAAAGELSGAVAAVDGSGPADERRRAASRAAIETLPVDTLASLAPAPTGVLAASDDFAELPARLRSGARQAVRRAPMKPPARTASAVAFVSAPTIILAQPPPRPLAGRTRAMSLRETPGTARLAVYDFDDSLYGSILRMAALARLRARVALEDRELASAGPTGPREHPFARPDDLAGQASVGRSPETAPEMPLVQRLVAYVGSFISFAVRSARREFAQQIESAHADSSRSL